MQMSRRTVLLTALAALLTLLLSISGLGSAANLTGGTYTYVINGEEATFAFDPVQRGDRLLLPAEVFQRFGIRVEAGAARLVTLRRANVTAQVTLGQTTFLLNGSPITAGAAPLRLNGRLFLPDDLLPHLGVALSVQDSFVVMLDNAASLPLISQVPEADWQAMLHGRQVRGSVRTDSGVFIAAEFMLLSPELMAAANLELSYGARARLFSLAEGHTLVLAKLSNRAVKAGRLDTSGIYLVDNRHRQYSPIQTLDIGQGALEDKLAPSADRTGVLLFPPAAGGLQFLQLYYDPNGEFLGSFTVGGS